MQTFVRVVEGKSLSSAARAQRLSLAAVSRQLRALEADLGATLVVRSTRRLHVTDAGRRWYDHCTRILGEVDAARAEVRSARAARGTLVVSAPFTLGALVLVPRLTRLFAQHPSLVIDLRLEDQIVDLVGEGVDVAVRAGSPPPDSTAIVAHPLTSMRRVLVAAPAYVRDRGTPRHPRELARHSGLIQVTPRGAVIRWELGSSTSAEALTPDVRGPFRTSAPLALRDAARNGLGIALLPDWLVAPDLEAGTLVRLLPEWRSQPITAWAIHRAELRGAARIRAFINAVRDRAG